MTFARRVEDIASSFSPPPNFSHLRESIHRIHKASLKLDHGKEKAEKALTRAADKWSRNRGHLCLRRSLEKWIKAIFGAHVNETTGDKHDRKLLRNLMKAARRVHSINKKLSSFESGFISEEGIRDREWYRHLGVAPGKWLGSFYSLAFSCDFLLISYDSAGYGATTFPALTEALQIEKNVTLAEYEADRLGRLIGRLSKSLNDY